MFEPGQILERKIFIHQHWAGTLQYIPKTVSLPDFKCFTQSFLLAWFFPLLLPIFISNPIKP